MRILAVDPGEQHLGLALSDETGTLARPLETFAHTARAADAVRIAAAAQAQGAGRILIGLALDAEGAVGPQARRAQRLAEAVRAVTALPVELVDESGSSREAAALGRRRHRADGLIHARAAAVILQHYLDEHAPPPPPT